MGRRGVDFEVAKPFPVALPRSTLVSVGHFLSYSLLFVVINLLIQFVPAMLCWVILFAS